MTEGMHPFQQEDDAATLLTNDERSGLVPSWVTFRYELNEVEQENIAAGRIWAFRQKRRDLLQERFLKDLHKQMLSDVWTWAGKYRSTERNIGVPAWQIALNLRNLLDDTRLWRDESVYEPDELAVRFHHRLVFIHPFPNGNGRHARLMADLLLAQGGGDPLTWGSKQLGPAGQTRTRYIEALREADAHNIAALIEFAHS